MRSIAIVLQLQCGRRVMAVQPLNSYDPSASEPICLTAALSLLGSWLTG